MSDSQEVIPVNPFEVRFLFHRPRDRERFKHIKSAVRKRGTIIQPIQVRDISGLPAKDRRREDGGLYKWESLFGEGRTLIYRELYRESKDPKWLRLPAQEKDVPESEVIARFFAENILRRNYPWIVQAQLIRDDVGDGEGVDSVAKRFRVTKGHAEKLLRILRSASPTAEREILKRKLTVEQAEVLTSLPPNAQEIVLETLAEEKLPKANVAAIVKKAKEVTTTAGLSKAALKATMRRLDEDLKRVRDSLKVTSLHYSLGPENMKLLLSDKKFRAAMDKRGVNYAKAAEASGI